MKSIVLIGFAAAGKSTVGKLLAQKLGCNFVDCDQLLQQTSGKSIADMFAMGEDYFRQQENRLLPTLPTTDSVIACGGGAVLCSNFASLARHCTVVWLDIDVATCQSRLGTVRRPLQDGKSATELAQMMDCRNPIYSKYANAVVDANGAPTQVIKQILVQLGFSKGEQL